MSKIIITVLPNFCTSFHEISRQVIVNFSCIAYNGDRKEGSMKVKVNQDACIGCGACASIASEVFELNEEGLSVAKEETVKEENQENVKEAADSCPTSAIEVEE